MKTATFRAASLFLFAACFVSVAKAADDDSTPIKWKKFTLATHFYSEGATFGDFNHDGAQDVAAGGYWYEGPDFTKKHQFADYPQQNPREYSKNFFAFSYSMKNDGWDDILIVGFPGEDLSWYENPRDNKDGSWVRHNVFAHVDNESPQWGDLLGTGKPVLICMSDNTVGYAQPDWTDPAKPWTWHACSEKNGGYGRFTHGLGWGDVNGDKKNDLLVHNGWYEQPASLDGNPQWKFHPADFGSGGAQMQVYDVNGDGRNDVITSLEAHGFGLAWFEQKADGTFEKHLIMGSKQSENAQGVEFSQLHAVDLIDIDGDGLKDIVTGKRFWAHTTDVEANAPAVLYWFQLVRKDGKAEFVAHKIDDDSGVGTEVMAQDINKDHHPAIVVGNKKGTFVFEQVK